MPTKNKTNSLYYSTVYIMTMVFAEKNNIERDRYKISNNNNYHELFNTFYILE